MKNKELIAGYNRYKLYIFPIITAFACLILIGLVILPQLNALVQNSRAEDDLLSRSKVAEAKAAELETFDEDNLNRDLSVALAVYPTDKDYAQVLGTLQKIAASYGYVILSAQVGVSLSQGNSKAYAVKMEVSGTRASFNRFLKGLENAPRVLRVSGLEIGAKGDRVTLTGTLNVDVFYSSFPNKLGGLEAPLPKLSDHDQALLSSLASNTASPSARQSPSAVPPSASPLGKEDLFK